MQTSNMLNYLKFFILNLVLIGGAFALPTRPVQKTQITGGDELFTADVVLDGGFNKLFVKSTIVPEALGDLLFSQAKNGGSNIMAVDGSTVPVTFTVPSQARDYIVNGIGCHAFDGGIKIDKFLGLNTALTNGFLVEIKSENSVFQFIPITNTQEFDAHFAWGDGRSFELIFASGNDSMVARFERSTPFIIKKTGTYPGNEDYIKFIVRDNLTSISLFECLSFGSLD